MEYQIVQLLHQWGLGKIDSVTIFISEIPFLIGLWSILAFFVLFRDKKQGRWIFLTVLAALALHFLISEGLLKHFLLNFIPLRERPWVAHPETITPLGKPFNDSPFPSSHMASTLAVLSVFVYYYRKVWPWALGFILLMAFARMHNGMHYPSDVLAGTILGICYGLIAVWLIRKIAK